MVVQNAPNPIVHRVSMNPENETRKVKTRLEEIFDEREQRAAQRFSAAELEKMALESENEVARLRGEPPKHKYYGGETMDDEEKKKQEEKQAQQREKLMSNAKLLIDGGMEPAQVGQMLMGLAPTGVTPVPSQGMGLDDVLKIVNLVVGKKEADELKGVISDLAKKVEDITKNPPRPRDESKPLSPIEFAKQQAEAVVAWNDALEALRPPPPVGAKGESLENLKETHRHEEKMEEIKNDKEYKQGMVEVLSDLPEDIGRGIGKQYSEAHSEKSGGGEMPYMTCGEEGCGAKIYYSPQAKQIECPRCGAIYAKEKTAEVEAGG